MADEGYLIGYEDVNGNFVQIGQFNNAADDVTQPLVLRHTNSGETLELDGSSFRPSTQIGDTNNRPDVFANTVDVTQLDVPTGVIKSKTVPLDSNDATNFVSVRVVSNESLIALCTAPDGSAAVFTVSSPNAFGTGTVKKLVGDVETFALIGRYDLGSKEFQIRSDTDSPDARNSTVQITLITGG